MSYIGAFYGASMETVPSGSCRIWLAAVPYDGADMEGAVFTVASSAHSYTATAGADGRADVLVDVTVARGEMYTVTLSHDGEYAGDGPQRVLAKSAECRAVFFDLTEKVTGLAAYDYRVHGDLSDYIVTLEGCYDSEAIPSAPGYPAHTSHIQSRDEGWTGGCDHRALVYVPYAMAYDEQSVGTSFYRQTLPAATVMAALGRWCSWLPDGTYDVAVALGRRSGLARPPVYEVAVEDGSVTATVADIEVEKAQRDTTVTYPLSLGYILPRGAGQ